MDEALLLEPETEAAAADVGRIIADELGIQLSDATARVRYGGGIIIERAAPDAVRAVRDRLARLGIRSRALTAVELVDKPRPVRAQTALLEGDHLVLRMSTGKEHVFSRDEVRALHLYVLPEPKRDDASEPPSALRREREARQRLVVQSSFEATFDFARGQGMSPRAQELLRQFADCRLGDAILRTTLFCGHPPVLFRLARDEVDYASLGQQKLGHSLDNFLRLLDEVVGFATEARHRAGAARFLQDTDPRPILMQKEEEVVAVDRWILQWLLLRSSPAIPPDAWRERT